MDGILSQETLYCLDMITVESGEILSLCGNFDGPQCRARLTFYPDHAGRRVIEGARYTKIGYETGYKMEGYAKVLDLPGEQHFVVDRSRIVRIYRPAEAFTGLSPENCERCRFLIDLLHRHCRVGRDRHGLTGSGALHSIGPSSDFDWVLYERNPTAIENCVRSHSCFTSELTFSMDHVYRKYAVFTGLNRRHLHDLFVDRWKYFRFVNLPVSMNFVDPAMRADAYLHTVQRRRRVRLRGKVKDGIGCYHMPRVIPVDCGGRDFLILTWLFLYNGAFQKGEMIEFSGQECDAAGERYILVQGRRDYMRKLTADER